MRGGESINFSEGEEVVGAVEVIENEGEDTDGIVTGPSQTEEKYVAMDFYDEEKSAADVRNVGEDDVNNGDDGSIDVYAVGFEDVDMPIP